jgi:hypothetical protein
MPPRTTVKIPVRIDIVHSSDGFVDSFSESKNTGYVLDLCDYATRLFRNRRCSLPIVRSSQVGGGTVADGLIGESR